MKVTKDFKTYLDHIELLSKTLPPNKKKELEVILSSMLTLLVSLKKASGLGNYKFEWEDDGSISMEFFDKDDNRIFPKKA